jgi:predicted phage terminase large subunit-like protein
VETQTKSSINSEQKQALRFALEKRLYKLDFFEFYKRAVQELEPTTRWSFPPHLKYLCETAQIIIENCANNIPQPDVCISVPPRTSKSFIFSVCLNAYAWTRYPHLKFMTLSYSDELSAKFSYKTRILILSDWYQKYFGDVFQINSDDNRKTAYSNNKSGTREAFGMTGSVTGSGADIIICDDLQKPSDVSDVKLDSVINVYRDTIFNRLNNPSKGGCRVHIAQRTHERDITNYVLQEDTVQHICLPMELTKDVKPAFMSAIYEDGLLWRERFDYEVLREYKKNPFYYNCQYLQNPQPQIGILIMRKWFPVISKDSIDEKVWQQLKWQLFLDTAYTSNEKNDETACIIAARYGNNVLIKKAYCWWLEHPQLIRKVKEVHALQMHPNDMIRIEKKANGITLIQALKFETTIPVTATVTPKDSKIVRITNITPYLESGRVMLLQDSGVDLMMQQFTSFPNSSRDGLVDTLYYAVMHCLLQNNSMRYGLG